jgi:hypothetical protein
MGEIVNLNKVRKARAKAELAAQAVANRVKHGRTPAERANDRRAEARRHALLDGAAREEGMAAPEADPPRPGPDPSGTR